MILAQPTTYRINIAMAKLGISRSTLYRLVDKGHLELIKISARASGITATSFAAYIEQQQAAARLPN
jgi:predicted DNA-binding transcriptional regulator AlpA